MYSFIHGLPAGVHFKKLRRNNSDMTKSSVGLPVRTLTITLKHVRNQCGPIIKSIDYEVMIRDVMS